MIPRIEEARCASEEVQNDVSLMQGDIVVTEKGLFVSKGKAMRNISPVI
jgi:hypothetical protein